MNRYREISDFARGFAAEFKGFMKTHKVTNIELADRLGRNDGYISERANGKRPLDADDVDALASLVPGWTGRDLMIELSRRVRVGLAPWSAAESATPKPNLRLVSGSGETVDPHEIDLSRGDLDLAASTDSSSVQDQTHVGDEDFSQDPNDK